MEHVNEESHILPATHTFMHKWHEPYLPLLSSRRVSPHFGWYSFPVPLRVGGWVGLVAGYIPRWFGRPKTAARMWWLGCTHRHNRNHMGL